MSDLISRQAAIEALDKIFDSIPIEQTTEILTLRRALRELPSAQPTGTNTVQVDDCISRQAAIDAVDGVPWYHQNKNGEMVHGANSDEHQAWYKAEEVYTAIESVPSAQPEIIHCKDCVHHIDGFFCRQANHHTSDKDHCASVFRAERRTDE